MEEADFKALEFFGTIRKIREISTAFSMPKAIFLPTAVCVPLWGLYEVWESQRVLTSLPVLDQPSEWFSFPFQVCIPT